MNRIYLAHDWYGPMAPLINNQTYTGKLKDFKVNRYGLAFFKKVKGYKSIPSIDLEDGDYFIYEIVLGHHDGGWVKQVEMDLLSTCLLSERLLSKIRNGRGYLLLDLAQESVIDDDVFNKIHNFCIKENIPLNKVIFQMGNSDAKNMYKDYCFRKGFDLASRLHISPIEYFEFKTSTQMSQNLKNIQTKNVDFNNITKTFLCLNRNYRYHRSNLFLLFNNYNLLKDSYYSMLPACLHTGVLWKDTLDEKLVKRYNFTQENIDRIQEVLPFTVDETDIRDVNKLTEVWGNIDCLYNTSLISVITETNYKNCIFNTEKTFKPIANRHPFIMVGPKGTLERLKTLGYKTFSEFWNEEYDNIEDDRERLEAVGELCNDINSWSDENKKRLFYETMAVTDHNYRLLKDITGESFRKTFWHNFRDTIIFGK
jgi:hypothetical protein